MIVNLGIDDENKVPGILTDKQFRIKRDLMKQDWFMAILYGAKRTGKTIFNNMLFLEELRRVRKTADREGVKNPMYILAGYSLGTIQKNVLEELSNMYGFEFHFDKYNRFKLFGVTVVQTGHGKISGIGAIRGMTAYGAYINEASISDESVFDEIKSRCSGEGARILADTNPDHPEHWLLKDYILNPSDTIRSYHFELMDNSFLSKRYIQNIIDSTPSGMFYDRNIKGLWVSGDGVVYADFDKEVHTVDRADISKLAIKEYFAGVDWGFEHYGSIVVIGVTWGDKYYLIEEHAHQHLQIEDWVEIGEGIEDRFGSIPFFCDSARPEYVKKFSDHFNAYNANKKVMAGIETVAGLFKQKRLFINYDEAPRFRQEIYNYIWHKTKDEPIKLYDDVMDAIRYAIMSYLTIEFSPDTEEELENVQALGL